MKTKLQQLILTILLLVSGSIYAQSNHGHEDGSKRLSSMYSENWDKTKGVFYANDSVTYKYTGNGKLLEAINLSYNTTTTIYNVIEIDYNVYDSKGNKILHVDSFLLTGLYVYRVRETFLNNNLGQVLSNTKQGWDNVNSVWAFNNKYLYTYNSDGNILTEITQYYNSATKIFDNTYKDSTIYNAQKQISKKFTFYWDKTNTKWVLYKRKTYFYSGTNKETGQLMEGYVSGLWVNADKQEKSFNSDDQEILNTVYTYSSSLLSWVYVARYSYYYDKVASTRTQIVENWNTATNVWDTTRKYVYQLNNAKWETGYTEYKWDATYHVFKNFARVTSTYNSNGYITFDNYEVFDDFSKVWKNNARYWFRYDEKSGLNKVKAKPSLLVYPNPVVGNTIQVNSPLKSPFQLFDLNGRLLREGNLQIGKNEIDLEGMSKGIYYLKAGANSNKIIKE